MMTESEDEIKYKNPLKKFFILILFRNVYFQIKKSGAGKILDIGCGEGYPDEYFLKKNSLLQIVGVDKDENAINRARDRNPNAVYLKGDINNHYSLGNKCDLVLLMEILEHLNSPQKALRQVVRLAPRTVVTVPFEPWFSFFSFLSGSYLKTFGRHPGHVNFWGRNSLEAFLLQFYNRVKIRISFPWLIAFCEISK